MQARYSVQRRTPSLFLFISIEPVFSCIPVFSLTANTNSALKPVCPSRMLSGCYRLLRSYWTGSLKVLLLECCDEDPLDGFRDVSLIVDGDLLQKAATIIDLRQIKRIVTVPGDRVFFEFAVFLPSRGT